MYVTRNKFSNKRIEYNFSEFGHQPGRCQSCHRLRRLVEPVPRQPGRLQGVPVRSDESESHLQVRHRQLAREENLRPTGSILLNT